MQVLVVVDTPARNKDGVAGTEFLLSVINGDRQNALQPIQRFVRLLMVVGAGTRARDGTMNSNTVAPLSVTRKRNSSSPILKTLSVPASIDTLLVVKWFYKIL
jgi:hypothetical protein